MSTDLIRAAAPARTTTPYRPPPLLSVYKVRSVVELKSFVREREAVVFTFAFPILLLVIFGAVFGRADLDGGVTFAQVFVAGMIAAGLFASSFQNLAIAIPIERDSGALKRLAGTPMPPSAYFVGKIVLVAVVAVVQQILLLAVGVLFYRLDLPTDAGRWLTYLWVAGLGVATCTLLGIAATTLVKNGKTAPAIISPIAIVLQFISGVFFVFTSLPGWMQNIASLFPLKWMCQGLRAVFLPESFGAQEPGGAFHLDRVALVLAGWCVLALVLCLTTFRWTTKRDG